MPLFLLAMPLGSRPNPMVIFSAQSRVRLSPLSGQRAGASAAACGGRLYVCGGAFGAQMLNSVERFDPKVGTWETLPPMSARRAYVAAATIAGTIHVFGGSDGGQCLLSSERFDPVANTWSQLPDMTERRSGAASVALMI
ncbi:Kelch-like protein diablo [Durusdinium trenchii]|uniref:Kelch-like protein diablo n=1 Tax=Durusdinium trenchii TaxID=1381693 RepID=A0ABP0RQN9_9DINO